MKGGTWEKNLIVVAFGMQCPAGNVSFSHAINIYIQALTQSIGLGYHQYAKGKTGSITDILAIGLKVIVGWLKQSWLKLNPLKIDVLCLG